MPEFFPPMLVKAEERKKQISDSMVSLTIATLYEHDCSSFSDHYFLSFDVTVSLKPSKPKRVSAYNYAKADFEGLGEFLSESLKEDCLQSTMVDDIWLAFRKKLFEGCDRFIPCSTFSRQSSPMWCSSDIRHRLNCMRTLKRLVKCRATPSRLLKLFVTESDLQNTL